MSAISIGFEDIDNVDELDELDEDCDEETSESCNVFTDEISVADPPAKIKITKSNGTCLVQFYRVFDTEAAGTIHSFYFDGGDLSDGRMIAEVLETYISTGNFDDIVDFIEDKGSHLSDATEFYLRLSNYVMANAEVNDEF